MGGLAPDFAVLDQASASALDQDSAQPWVLAMLADSCTLPPWTGKEALPVLLKVLRHSNEGVRHAAACGLLFWTEEDAGQANQQRGDIETACRDEQDACVQERLQAVLRILDEKT